MPPASQPAFGKRNAPRLAVARPVTPDAPTVGDHAAFFAAVRAEMAEAADAPPLVVPRAFRAAFLSGLVTGCALAGFDVTGDAGAARFTTIAGLLGLQVDTSNLLPAMILLGLVGGARAAAMTVLLVHWLLARAGWTQHAAYALGGAAAAAALAGALFVLTRHEPAHGWIIECVAGAASGFFYRVFAGARPA